MRNFPVTVDGHEFWISRSCAVVGVMLKTDGKEPMVLANKRGPGCPDFVGYWNIPCGYIDYNETLQEAVVREVYEETGLVTKPDNWEFLSINSDPKDSNKQNITVRWISVYNENMGTFNTEHSEKDEVEDVKWIPLSETDKYEWAFGQEKLLKEIIDSI
jgi:8-oxo-dGTP pyrophosphatase MutT (NUDIX family)